MPPHHTHLGNRFFEFEYINIIQDYFSLLISCRNVTLRSHNTVSEHDTPIQFSHYLFHQAFFIQGIILIERVQDKKFNNLIILGQPQTT